MNNRKTNHTPSIEPRALAFIAGAAAVIIALTNRTWIDFRVHALRGTDADAMTGVGDGYFVIALAIVAIACAGAVYMRPKFWHWLLPLIGVSAVSVMAIAAYDAATPWHAAGFDSTGVFVVRGHVHAAVYEVLALAAAIGVVAAVLASIQYQAQRREDVAQLSAKGPRHDQPNPRAAGRLRPR